MSIPSNPLEVAPSSAYKQVLIAFQYAEDAFQLDRNRTGKIDPTKTLPGESIPGFGPNVVIINEFLDGEFSINEAVWSFNYLPSIGVSTSCSVGKIVVDDRIVPYRFPSFLRSEVKALFNGQPGATPMSLSHATFALKTYFILEHGDTAEDDMISSNPFFFNIESLESVPKSNSITPHSHIMKVVGVANTLGLARSMTAVFQMDITHKDGNVHNEIPSSVDSQGIVTRSSENERYTSLRKERLDKSKPMLTLKDMFEGLEADLNQQKFTHQGQLQRWLREIRNDHVDKIVVAPQQTKGPTPEQLPIDFKIDLDPIYYDYNVDNRNMPFEQPDVRQENVGIRSFPVRTGTELVDLVERIMLLSKDVGSDARQDPPLTYKTTVTAQRTKANRYLINIKIRQYTLPHSHADEKQNTGPGNNIEPLRFFVNDPNERDIDIISFKSDLNFRVGDRMLERQTPDNPSAGIVYGDREQGTAERRPMLSFFETIYSGIRPMIGSYTNDGLESAERAGDIMNLMDPYTYTQTTDYELVIRGNPNLLSDLNRNPLDVIEDENGAVNYYPRPEVDPMYIKLSIFLSSMSLGAAGSEVPEKYYFDSFYHMYEVVNMFGVIRGKRSFYQLLRLKRTDDTI